MLKFSHAKMITFSGLVWFVIGFYLLELGLSLLVGNLNVGSDVTRESHPLLHALAPYLGSIEMTALALVVVALLIGYLKGRYVLGKSAKRGADRLKAMDSPIHITKIYSPTYYLLLGGMVCLGISIKYFGLSNDIRGWIDVIIGSALINGAMIYFKIARQSRSQA